MSNIAPPLTNPLIENDYFYLSSDGTYYIVGTEDYKKYGEMKTKLSGDVVIPEEYNGKPVKEIGIHSFYGTDIRSLFVPDSIEKIHNGSDIGWYGCSPFAENKLMESIRLPENILELPKNTFCGNRKLKYVKIPENVTDIPHNAFYGCDNLSCVDFPSNLKTIGSFAFHKTCLTNISIPESVESFGDSVFGECKHLTNVIFKGNPEFDKFCVYEPNSDSPVSVIGIGCNLDALSKIYVVDGKGWTGIEMFYTAGGLCSSCFIPIEILPEGGATVAKNMTVKSMVFS